MSINICKLEKGYRSLKIDKIKPEGCGKLWSYHIRCWFFSINIHGI